MQTNRLATALTTVALVVSLVVALTTTPSGSTRRSTPTVSWAGGAGGVAVELDAPGLFPGAVVTRSLLVTNRRSEPVVVSLSVSSVGDDALAQVLDVEIKSRVRRCAEPSAARTGVVETTGTAAAAELGPLHVPAASSLRLCVRVTMRLSADDSVQGLRAITTVRLVTNRMGADTTR
jgi:hypothetical protein